MMAPTNLVLSVVLLLVLTGATSTAFAQPEADAEPTTEESDDSEARALFELASVHYRDGRFLDAAAEFEQAYELSGQAVLTHNIYLCYRDANQPEEAALWLRRYLESDLEIPNRANLEARLDALERSIAEDEAEVTGEPAGAHDGPSTANIVGHATSFMIAGLTLISGVVTGIMTVSAHADLSERCRDMEPYCSDPNGPADKERMQNLALATDILLATSLTAAAVGLVIALLGHGGDEEPAPVACGAGGCRFEASF
jgi:tetratricopeptide (TPR) repeat protein